MPVCAPETVMPVPLGRPSQAFGRRVAQAPRRAALVAALCAGLGMAPAWADMPEVDAGAPAGDEPASVWAAEPARPDWSGARRDAGYFVGYQAVALAALALAPEAVTGWSTEDKKNYSFDKWRENVSHPVWDDDAWVVNYVLHPYWGGAYYTRARERGLDRTQAFWYSALLSTLWEYGAEALAEPVSIQDMIVTPVVGSLVGEYLFKPWRDRIRAQPGPLDWSDQTLLALTDPLGAINGRVDRWLGVQSSLQWQFGGRSPGAASPGPPGLAPPQRTLWRLQWRVRW
jgi:hypothetical protein